MRKQPHHLYFSLLLFTVFVNLIVYLQFTESIADTSKNRLESNIKLQNGDLVLRNSKGLLSSVFRNSSLHQRRFTHAGLLHKINNKWFVYHFIDDDKKGGLHIEPLSHFIDNNTCIGYSYYRYNLNQKDQQKLDSIISIPENQFIPFDSAFDLSTDSSMYCSEWIAKTLSKATGVKNFIHQTSVAGYTYIAPDNLYLNMHCKLIYNETY